MDKARNPGISLQGLHLLECVVSEVKPNSELRYALAITEFARNESADTKNLIVTVGFDLMANIENPACKFTCKFQSTYGTEEEANMKWSELPDHVVIAHIIPFFREFVSNMTHRMPISALVMVPPINTLKLLSEFQKAQPVAGDLASKP